MVRAGESGGILDDVLDRLATQQEKDAEIISKVRSAMIYPAVITIATISAFFFLMTVIVPKLSSIFADAGASLPIYTKIMLAISSFMVHDSGEVLGGANLLAHGSAVLNLLGHHTELIAVNRTAQRRLDGAQGVEHRDP